MECSARKHNRHKGRYLNSLVGLVINIHCMKGKRGEVAVPFVQQCLRNPKSIVQGILPRSSSYSISTSNVAHKRIYHNLKQDNL
jgi:hypothetical protein